MKKIYLTTLIISTILCELHAEIIRTEYKKAVKNTYKLEYNDEEYVFISNVVNPFEGLPNIQTNKIKFKEFTGRRGGEIINACMGPYTRSFIIDEEDYDKDSFFVFVYFDLNGDMAYVSFACSSKLIIPLIAFEELEAQLKKESKAILEYNPDDVQEEGVHFIRLMGMYSFIEIQRKQLEKDGDTLPAIPLVPIM